MNQRSPKPLGMVDIFVEMSANQKDFQQQDLMLISTSNNLSLFQSRLFRS